MNEDGLMSTVQPAMTSKPRENRTQGWSLAGSYEKAANIRNAAAAKAAMPSANSINVSTTKYDNNSGIPTQQGFAQVAGHEIDMGVKPSGAPVNFTPTEQNRMTNMFGQALYGSYDRIVSSPVAPPADVYIPKTPDYGFSY